MLVQLLSGQQLDDQLAAAHWLEAQSFVQPRRVAVMGNSFGGIETVFGAERHPYCAAVNLTGAAMSWDEAPLLQKAMTEAVQQAQAPIHIYPPFQGTGSGGMQGHSFAWLGASLWFPEAFDFINRHCH